jgi:hypothetical protein
MAYVNVESEDWVFATAAFKGGDLCLEVIMRGWTRGLLLLLLLLLLLKVSFVARWWLVWLLLLLRLCAVCGF